MLIFILLIFLLILLLTLIKKNKWYKNYHINWINFILNSIKTSKSTSKYIKYFSYSFIIYTILKFFQSYLFSQSVKSTILQTSSFKKHVLCTFRIKNILYISPHLTWVILSPTSKYILEQRKYNPTKAWCDISSPTSKVYV